MSALVPDEIAWVGQALAQAGSRPTGTRSEHKVHLWAFLEIRGMLNGQPLTQ
jgi:hypothetical protein